jgi:cation transport regulator ChaB
MNVRYQPLPIRDQTDEMAFEVFNAIFSAWQTYQDKQQPTKETAKAEGYIKRLWVSAKLRRKGPRAGGLKQLVAFKYDEMLPLAREALEEYRGIERISKSKGVTLSETRKEAKGAAIDLILERLVPERRRMESERKKTYQIAGERLTAKRNNYREKMESWNWLNRRTDGLARDLTALDLGIKPASVHVLRFRAQRK